MLTNKLFSGLTFSTSNAMKVEEYSAIAGEELRWTPLPPIEPEVFSKYWKLMANKKYLELAQDVAARKAEAAYNFIDSTQVAIEATLFFIDTLDGFPGPFVGDLEGKRAYAVLSRLTSTARFEAHESHAVAIATLATFSPKLGVQVRHGSVEGRVALVPNGECGFGWDSIFQPYDESPGLTFAEMAREKKNLISMRRQAVNAILREPFLVEPISD